MNKAEFVDFIAGRMETSKAEASRFLDIFIEGIHKNINKEEIRLSGLGTFNRTKRKARSGRNPQTGEEIKIPAKWAPTFKAGSALKEVVQRKK